MSEEDIEAIKTQIRTILNALDALRVRVEALEP